MEISMNASMLEMMRKFACSVIEECGNKYNFPVEEAMRELKLVVGGSGKVGKVGKVVSEKVLAVKVMKASFPLPFNYECNSSTCQALRQNNGLYTQCQGKRISDGEYCKSCQQLSEKSDSGIPEYGTISSRMAVNVLEYVDPKGRKPTSYTKVMKKYNLTREQVLEEASRMGVTINEEHFVVPEETKRGRPASKAKEEKSKGVKGRPKKTSKVVQLADDEEDLFASLVAAASNPNSESENLDADTAADTAADTEVELEEKNMSAELEKSSKLAAKEAEKAAKAEAKAAKEAQLAEKKAQMEAEKAAKEAQLAEKKAQMEAEKAAKEAQLAEKKAQVEAEKAAKLAAKEAEKASKLAAKEAEKASKLAAKESKPAKSDTKTEEDTSEPEETYKKCTGPDNKKYIRSQQTGIVYDFEHYTATEELIPLGRWVNQCVVFNKAVDSDSELSDDEVEE
jgi:hypothetical protein